jgi:hypothetical protein
MLYPLAGNLADAQDLAQEAFCRAGQRWSVLSGYDEPVGTAPVRSPRTRASASAATTRSAPAPSDPTSRSR